MENFAEDTHGSLDISYAPPGEDAYTLLLERTDLAGQFVANVFYGIFFPTKICDTNVDVSSLERRGTSPFRPNCSFNDHFEPCNNTGVKSITSANKTIYPLTNLKISELLL